jgi:hypothetical protein
MVKFVFKVYNFNVSPIHPLQVTFTRDVPQLARVDVPEYVW